MRKIKNKKSIRRLADKSFRSNRTRNIIAALAIAMTTMLFTTLFTIGLGTIESFQQLTMRQSGGNSHGVLKHLSQEQYEKLKDHPSIRECAPCIITAEDIRNPEFLKRHLEAWYMPVYHYGHCFIEILEGEAPDRADEILMDQLSLELLGLDPVPGQEVTLQMQLRPGSDTVTDRTFRVSGVIRSDPALNVGFAIVSQDYLTKYASELTYTYDQDYASTGTIRLDVNFSNPFGIQKKLDKIIEDCGYSTDPEQKNYIDSNANWGYLSDSVEGDPLTMGALAAGLFLVFLTGYLIIYNVFQISVMKDIRYYGLLKTIGTTGRQVKMILRRQAAILSVLGIPLGILTGFFIGKAIVPVIIAQSSFQGEAQVTFHPLILIGAVLFTLATVFISIGKPSRMAAKVSPVDALRYTDQAPGRRKKTRLKKSARGGRIPRMALSNLTRNKERTAIVILSLSLAIILLNSVFTITRAFDIDLYLKKFATFDFLIGNARYFGMDRYRGITDNTIDSENLSESFIAACKSREGFEKGGRIYENSRISLDAGSYQIPEYVPRDEKGIPYGIIGGHKIPLVQDERGSYFSWTDFYGLDDFPLSAVEVWKGETDIEVIRKKLASGKYLLSGVQTDDNERVVEDSVMHQPGDQVTLVLDDGTKRQFEILSLIKINYYGISKRSWSPFVYYTTSDIFLEMASPKYLMSYGFDVEDGKEEDFLQFVKQYTSTEEPLMSFESKQTSLQQFSQLSGLFVLIGGVLTIVISLIGVLNFINTILTGIISRRKEFAMMEAIGMTRKQLARMLMLEGLSYAGITICASFLLGLICSLTIVRTLTEGLWFMKYHFIIWPMAAVFPVLLILGGLIPYLVYLPQRKEELIACLAND